MITENFNEIPQGLFLLEMNHESYGVTLHIGLKVNNGEWHEQARCPVYSENATKAACVEFWEWARNNLPTFRYAPVVRRAVA